MKLVNENNRLINAVKIDEANGYYLLAILDETQHIHNFMICTNYTVDASSYTGDLLHTNAQYNATLYSKDNLDWAIRDLYKMALKKDAEDLTKKMEE